jgi:hypothetical protein
MVGFFTERGLPATGAVHKPDPQGDQRNVHAHIVYNARPCKRLPDGTWDFCDVKNRPNILEEVRSRHWIPRLRVQWADACNERLLDLPGKRRLYTPHSFKKLGIDKLPTGHLGPHASALERQGVATKQGTINARREHEYQARLIERAHQDRLAKVAEHRAKLEGRKASLHPETVITILNLAGYLEHSANRLRQLDSAELVTDRCLRRPRTAASFYRASLADPNLRPELALRYRERLAEAEKLHDRTTAALFADKIRHGSKARYLRRARLRGEITGAVTGARRRR